MRSSLYGPVFDHPVCSPHLPVVGLDIGWYSSPSSDLKAVIGTVEKGTGLQPVDNICLNLIMALGLWAGICDKHYNWAG